MFLDVSAEVRYRLLGHQDRSIKSNYQNWEWDILTEKVDEAHIKILKEFRVEEIWKALQKRGRDIGLPLSVVTKTLMIRNANNLSVVVLSTTFVCFLTLHFFFFSNL